MTPEIQWDAGECKAASKRILWYKVPQAYLLSLVWLRIFPLGKFPLALLFSSDLRRFYLSLSCFLPLHRSMSLSHAAPAWWHSEPCWEEPEHLQWANTLQRHRKSCTKDHFFFFPKDIPHANGCSRSLWTQISKRGPAKLQIPLWRHEMVRVFQIQSPSI